MKKYYFLILFSCFNPLLVSAQKNQFISGIISDKSSGEVLIGTSVRVLGSSSGTKTNNYGHFSIMISSAKTSLIVTNVGYQSDTVEITENKPLKIELTPLSSILEEVKIMGESISLKDFNQIKIPVRMIEKLPSLLGETDVLKNIQMLPGVQSGVDGSSGFHVRGGSPDQNLILLDGVPVYNVNHFFGFFSTFNTDAISNVDFYKNIIPARFGGRLSSVVDLSMKEGNTKTSKINFSLSPVAGRLLFESPLIKDKVSLMLSYRRTWLDLPLKLINERSQTSYYFDDFNAKINFQLSPKNKLFLSYYTGIDVFDLKQSNNSGDSKYKYGFNWGNKTLSLRWNKSFSSKLFANIQTGYSKFEYNLTQGLQTSLGKETVYYSNQVNSGIRDIFVKSDFNLSLNEKHELSMGMNIISHQFMPEAKQTKSLKIQEETADSRLPDDVVNALELGLYLEDKYRINDINTLNIGVRQDVFKVNNTTYMNLQPRISFSRKINESTNLDLGYGRTAQFIHLVVNSSLNLPTDLWIPSNDNIKPEKADVVSLGFTKRIKTSDLIFSAETYFKTMSGLTEYKEGGAPLNDYTVSWDSRITTGNGNAYGLELMLQKNTGKLQGWGSYTLAWANRTFDDLNLGKTFPYKYDRRHNFSLVATYDFAITKKHRRTFSMNFVYASGYAMTLPGNETTLNLPDNRTVTVKDFSNRNNFRTPASHRLDISYQATRFKNHGNTRTWSLGIINVYNHLNPTLLYQEKETVKQLSLIPIMPSISYQRSF